MTRLAFSLTVALVLIGAAQAIAQDEATLLARKACMAVSTDLLDDLDKALSEGANLSSVTCGEQNLIAIAAVRASPDVLEYLAREGVDIDRADAQGYTPIMRALEQGRVDNALKLRDLGASLDGVTSDGYTVRVLAELVGLADFGPKPPRPDALLSQAMANELLLRAAEFGDMESVRLALDSNADVSIKADNGWTPVMIAALAGRADIVELLAKKGALGMPHEPLDKVGDHVDAIVAALIGRGNGDPGAVDAILTAILRHKDVSADNDYYRAVAARQGHYPELVDHYFPANDLPPLEIDLPLITANDRDSWAKVQQVLADKGLYRGAIDGVPGAGTFSAMVGYLEPFEDLLLRRGVTAMRRAQNLQKAFDRPSVHGYGAFDWRGRAFGQVRLARNGPVGAGYFGSQDNLEPTDVRCGYFDSRVSTEKPVMVVSQWVGDDKSDYRMLELRIAGGTFSIIRGPERTQAILSPDGGLKPIFFNFAATNVPLPVEPLPGANLMEKVEPLGDYSVILDASD